MTYLVAYLVTAGVFLAVDALWLGVVAARFYKEQLGGRMRAQPGLGIAGAFYAVYAVGIVVFAVAPALAAGGWTTALWRGLLFGFCAYGTYDLTNLATLKRWPARMAVVDLAWGTALTAFAAVAGTVLTAALAGR